MSTEVEMQEYLEEIRQEVCSRCVERPPEGPPCGPLGKPCGVELHLSQLVEAVQLVHSNLIEPYQDANRREVCQCCPFQYSAFCPCPMDSLAVLVVQAIEKVDQRRASDKERKPAASPPGRVRPDVEETFRACGRPDIEDIRRIYEEAAGTWTGCDWPVEFGMAELNVGGCTAAALKARAVVAVEEEKTEWEAAIRWLEEVERRAREAQAEAEMALKEARVGAWRDAAKHAQCAWSLEFATGRPFRRQPAIWQRLFEVLAAAAWVNSQAEAADTTRVELPTL